jgi:hypothetical protein
MALSMPDLRVDQSTLMHRRTLSLLLLIVGCILLYAATRPLYVGDAPDYEADILSAAGSGNTAGLWEAGHVLWRPLGLLLYRGVSAVSPHADANLLAWLALTIPNLVAGVAVAALLFEIALAASGSLLVSWLTAFALASANAYLNYAQGGSCYIAGLLPFTLACWLLFRRTDAHPRFGTVAAAGVLLSIAILIWLPFAVAAPGVAAIVLLWGKPEWRRSWKPRLLRVGQLTATVVVSSGLGYVAAISLRGLSTAAEARDWFLASSHGWRQSANLVRFVWGLPRGFLNLGNDGILFKRYLWHDPYAAVLFGELVRTTLAKLVLFYLFFAGVAILLLLGRKSRNTLTILAAAALPLFVFAVLVFEPGSPERYLPLYPFLAAAIASGIAGARRPAIRTFMLGLLGAAILSSAWSQSVWRTGREDRESAALVASIKPALNRHSLLWIPAMLDPLVRFATTRPLDQLNRPMRLPVRVIVPAGLAEVAAWRRRFARETLAAMDKHGTVWVSTQVMAERPKREWNWTEGDIPGVKWRDLPEFFRGFEYSPNDNGGCPFLLLRDTARNRDKLVDAEGISDPPAPEFRGDGQPRP